MSKRDSTAAEQLVEQQRHESSKAVKSQETDSTVDVQSGIARTDSIVDISSEGRKKLVMGRLISRIVSADTCSKTFNGKKKS